MRVPDTSRHSRRYTCKYRRYSNRNRVFDRFLSTAVNVLLIVCCRIWTTSLSTSLPPTVKLDGFDVTDAQFPPKEWLPANVTLNTLNILDPVPEYLLGKYDVVNIRYFALVVKNNNILGLLKNLISILSEYLGETCVQQQALKNHAK